MSAISIVEVDRAYRDEVRVALKQDEGDMNVQFHVVTRDLVKYGDIAERVFALEGDAVRETFPFSETRREAFSLHNELLDFTFAYVISHGIQDIYGPLIKELVYRLVRLEQYNGDQKAA